MSLGFTGERIVPGAADCEPTFAQKMYQEHVARYAFAGQFAKDADVLDVGCGVGYGTQWLAKSGARSVLGFDLSEAAIEHARMNYFHPAVSFKVQDATAIESGGGYGLVTCFELIEHVAQQEHVLDLIKGTLHDDGALVISTPRPLDKIRTNFHVHEMTFEELHRLLKQRFKHVEPFFQVNCFTSFIGATVPERIDRVVPVTNRIDMAHADYFVFVASDAPIPGRTDIAPLLSMNDDGYILTLEKDVGVLRRAENDHIARIADLERSERDLTAIASRASTIEQVRQDTALLRQAMEQFGAQLEQRTAPDTQAESDGLRQQVRQLTETVERQAIAQADGADVRQQVRDLSEQLDRQAVAQADRDDLYRQVQDLRGQLEYHAAVQTERDHLHEQVRNLEKTLQDTAQPDEMDKVQRMLNEARHIGDAQRIQYEAELDRVRRALAETSAKLVDRETQAFALRGDAVRLPEALAHASALENELNALRYRFAQSEATLTRFRSSFSWAITRPLRWIGRTYRTATGRSLPQ